MVHGIDSEEYIARGVAALARSAGEHWVTGHVGATLLAGTWLLRGGTLPEASARELAARLRRSVAADPARYARPEAGMACGVDPLVRSLDAHVGDLHNSAHGTIYAAAALRAFDEQPGLATDATVAAIVRVYEGAQQPDPDRYFATPDHARVVIEGEPEPTFDAEELIAASFRELAEIHPDQTLDGRRYFFAGEKLHLVTHAHALLGLDALGHAALARRGLIAHRRQRVLTRQKPPGDAAPYPPGAVQPEDGEFWRISGDPWHDVKFAHAVAELWRRLSESRRDSARWQLSPAWSLLA